MGGKSNAQMNDAKQSRITDFFGVRPSPPSGVTACYMESSSATYFAPEKCPVASSARVGPTHAVPYGLRTAKRKLDLFDINELETPSTGIGADEEVLLPSGGFKKVRDLKVGDFVLNEEGEPVEVLRAPTVVEADAFEVSCNTTSTEGKLHTPQEVVVGGLQRLEVTIQQRDSKIKTNERNGYKSCVTQSFFELLASEKPGEWVICKPRKTRRSVAFPDDGEHGAKTKEEAVSKLAIEFEKLDIPQVLRYYPQAYHLVHYEEPECGPQRYFHYATHLDTDVRESIRISTGVVFNETGDFCPERRRMNELIGHFDKAQQQLVLYLAGLWIGLGDMSGPTIVVGSDDVESIRRCAEITARLGLCCDVGYYHLTSSERGQVRGFQQIKDTLLIRVTSPQGVCKAGLAEISLLHELIWNRREEDLDWSENDPYKGEQSFFNQEAAEILIYNGWSVARHFTTSNWLWEVFQLMRITRPDGVNAKVVPLWLVTAPIAWREACLAGLIEGGGYRSDESDVYRYSTIYPELYKGAVAIARSLSIRSNASSTTNVNTRECWESLKEEVYEITLEACDALSRAMRLVATPYLLPRNPPGSGWLTRMWPLKFTVTPKGRHELGAGLEVEGHEFVLRNALLVLDCFADKLDTTKRTEQVLIGDRCIARGCNDVLKKDCGPSWDTREGRLCGTHWRWYEKANMYCPLCKYVPPQMAFVENLQCERIDESNEQCPGVYVSVPPDTARNTRIISNSS